MQQPRLPIPPPLMMSEPGSFAYLTLTQRWPAIARRVAAENDFPTDISNDLSTLVEELFNGEVRYLKDDSGPDLVAWAKYLEPFVGRPWIDIPWYFAESYFYRRLLEATQYFQPGPWQGVDPFASQKRHSLETAKEDIQAISTQINPWSCHEHNHEWQTNLVSLLYVDLWGNQADLSLKPNTLTPILSANKAHILVDDTRTLVKKLINLQQARIDLVADNTGAELVYDLFLADFLLASKIASTVHLHLKTHPTFVSDATIRDVHNTLQELAASHGPNVQTLTQKLESHIATGQLQLRENPFWTAPLVFWEMPQPLRQELSQADLVFLKGDANYRRLLGDCHWPFTTQFLDVVCYFPAPFVTLRTLKAEIIIGLQLNQVEALYHEDPQWLTSGQWGVIQFADLPK